MVYIANAFALSMIEGDAILRIKEISKEEVKEILTKEGFVSAVGHQSTAEILSQLLDINIPFNRVQIKITSSDKLIVFQLLVRLEEGKILSKEEISKLPFKFFLIERG